MWPRMRAQLALIAPRSTSAQRSGFDSGRRFAHESRDLAWMRRQHTILAQLALRAGGDGQGVEAIGVDRERALRVHRKIQREPPRRAVPAQPGTDDPDRRGRELPED